MKEKESNSTNSDNIDNKNLIYSEYFDKISQKICK